MGLKFAGCGLELAANVVAGFAVGYWIDKKFQLLPYCTISGASLGLVWGLWRLVKTVAAQKDAE